MNPYLLNNMPTTKNQFTPWPVIWAGQAATVVEETASQVRIQFTNATGFCDMWLNRAAALYYPNRALAQKEN